MSRYGASFQGSRAHGFVESVAIERNTYTDRALMTCGVGPGVEYTNLAERAIHSSFNDIHSTRLNETIAIGAAGASGSDSINGSGWARIFLRVRGVAHKIPPIDYQAQEGGANLNRAGSLMWIEGFGVHSALRTTHRYTLIHSGGPVETPMIQQGRVALNVFDDVEVFATSTHQMDRIIAFSAQLPVTYSPRPPAFAWTNSVFPAGGLAYIFNGGSLGSGVSTYTTSQAAIGVSVRGEVCNNTLNSTDLITGSPMFVDPTNRIQLQVQRLGYRPAAGPEPEAFHDLS
jgi:hypothetical protein